MEARDQSGKPMSDDQLIAEIKTIIVAGHENHGQHVESGVVSGLPKSGSREAAFKGAL